MKKAVAVFLLSFLILIASTYDFAEGARIPMQTACIMGFILALRDMFE